MKALHKLIIRSFIPPFFATFLVTWFVFIIQFFWVYIDDLVGKGLEISIIAKLTFYLAPTVIPMALPLGVLLAGIMTLGNLAESNELTAIKSAGISLQRFIKPLFIIVVLLSGLAFLFNNYVIPVANLKFYTLLSDIRNKKPAVNIKAGFFYDEIPGYSIYIGKKNSDNQGIEDIMIYDHNGASTNNKVVLAQKGKMYITSNEQFLIFELENGWRYEERKENKDKASEDQIRMGFKYWKKIFDLSAFSLQKSKDDFLKSNEAMMNNHQLQRYIDTCNRDMGNFKKRNHDLISPIITLVQVDSNNTYRFVKNQTLNTAADILKRCPDSLRKIALQSSETNARNIKSLLDINCNDFDILRSRDAKLKVEWHKKLSFAVACLVLFLIGAPLGAIIKKGGFGLPFVFAVAFFVVYYFLNVIGEKMCKELVAQPRFGMWMANTILMSLALFIMYKASSDSTLLNMEWYKRQFSLLKEKFIK